MSIGIWIFLGGGLGALSRYSVGQLISSGSEGKIPLGALSCNLIGCFLIGCFFAWQKDHHPEWLSPLLVTGFLGGFTTFSSFGLESLKLYEAGAFLNLLLYILISLLGGLLAVLLAVKIVR